MLARLFSFHGRYRILHLTWFAFFLTFVVWFNFAPFSTAVQQEFGLASGQVRTIAICNVALTVPARVVIGMLLDRFGPKLTFSVLLVYAAIPCLAFGLAQNFAQLVASRLAMSILGAGFVIGIRMNSEWFPPREVGFAEGVYAGWGNSGSAASAFILPWIAAWLTFGSGELLNWRYAVILTGILVAVYGVIYYFSVEDTPPGRKYQRPQRHGGLEVTTKKDFWLLMIMNIPLVGVLALLAWRLTNVGFMDQTGLIICAVVLLALYLYQVYRCWDVNKDLMKGHNHYPPEDRYQFNQVVLLELTYIVGFGSELAVISMLPAFYETTFTLDKQAAGMIASTYAFMNLVSRPGGGLISDSLGSRRWTMIVLPACMGIGYLLMSSVGGSWWLPAAVILTMACSFFVQASEGSTFAIVPLIKRRVIGQVAGNVGAYGNVGAVLYLTLFSLLPANEVGYQIFFQTLGIAALIVAFLCLFFLKEPKDSFAEYYEGEQEYAASQAETRNVIEE